MSSAALALMSLPFVLSSPITTLSIPQYPNIMISSNATWPFLGCYTEGSGTRALAQEFASDKLTTEDCLALCTGYNYAGTEYGRECWCGDTLGNGSALANASECNFPCAGNSSETCGGSDRLDLYILDSFAESTAPSNSTVPASKTNLSEAAITAFQVANFLENLGSDYFNTGLANLTRWGVYGYPNTTYDIVRTVAAQEPVHVATIEGLLNTYGATTILPCQYHYPGVDTTASFFRLATTITSVDIGYVIDLTNAEGENNGSALIPTTASLLAVEGRHDAFFRAVGLNAIPNPSPFDTRISATWALNLAIQNIIPGSCPGFVPAFESFPVMYVVPPVGYTGIAPVNGRAPAITPPGSNITFAILPTTLSNATTVSNETAQTIICADRLFVAWVNQVAPLVYTAATLVPGEDGPVRHVTTLVPSTFAGIAFAALTDQDTVGDVDKLTAGGGMLAGPAVVQVS